MKSWLNQGEAKVGQVGCKNLFLLGVPANVEGGFIPGMVFVAHANIYVVN
jgi:hypothetical protein